MWTILLRNGNCYDWEQEHWTSKPYAKYVQHSQPFQYHFNHTMYSTISSLAKLRGNHFWFNQEHFKSYGYSSCFKFKCIHRIFRPSNNNYLESYDYVGWSWIDDKEARWWWYTMYIFTSTNIIYTYTYFRCMVMLRRTPANFQTACIVNEFSITMVVNGRINESTIS